MNNKKELFRYLIFAFTCMMAMPLYAFDSDINTRKSLEHRIEECFKHVVQRQTQDSCSRSAVLGIERKRGLYHSKVHFHIKGGIVEKTLRREFGICDNNFFVTAWIQELMIESYNFGLIDNIDQQLDCSMQSLFAFYDKNTPNSSLVNFWEQNHYDTDKQLYYVYPEHLAKVAKVLEKIGDVINAIAYVLGIDRMIEKIVEESNMTGFFDQIEKIIAALHIPPDTDDSALNISLGCMLKCHASKGNEKAFAKWRSENNYQTIKAFMQKCVRYAYKPFNQPNDSTCTEIDPRTYFFLHEFLDKKASKGELSLLTTWLTMRQETVEKAPFVHMPFNVNNVDVSVCANFINALAYYAVTFPGEMELLLQEVDGLKELIVDTEEYLEWAIGKNKILERPDIGALYYPSAMNSFWFVARTLSLLSGNQNRARLTGEAKVIFTDIHNKLEKVMMDVGVPSILGQAQKMSGHTDSLLLCWDDFLGQHDKNVCPITKNDDRVYTSAIALNSLMDIYTQRSNNTNDIGYSVTWKRETTEQIKQLIHAGIRGLLKTSSSKKHLLNLYYQKENAFFSGSVKENTFPFLYPFNELSPLIKEPEKNEKAYRGRVIALKGYVEKTAYDSMIVKCTPPTKFNRYKNSGPFPFWSSPALTHALVLNVLSKYHQLIYANI